MNLVSSISVYPRIGISRSASETDVKILFIFSEQIGLAASEVFYNHILYMMIRLLNTSALKEITSQTVSLSTKTYVFEDKLTKYKSV